MSNKSKPSRSEKAARVRKDIDSRKKRILRRFDKHPELQDNLKDTKDSYKNDTEMVFGVPKKDILTLTDADLSDLIIDLRMCLQLCIHDLATRNMQ